MAKRDKTQKTKKEEVEKMFQYTSRDIGQEYIMKRKMIRAILIMIMAVIALIVFIALYVNEVQRVQETYRRQYYKSLDAAIELMQEYEEADGNFEMRYRMIFAEITNLNSFSFLMENQDEVHRSINELYTVFLKYPKQVDARMTEIRKILENVKSAENNAMDELNKFVESIDKKGD